MSVQHGRCLAPGYVTLTSARCRCSAAGGHCTRVHRPGWFRQVRAPVASVVIRRAYPACRQLRIDDGRPKAECGPPITRARSGQSREVVSAVSCPGDVVKWDTLTSASPIGFGLAAGRLTPRSRDRNGQSPTLFPWVGHPTRPVTRDPGPAYSSRGKRAGPAPSSASLRALSCGAIAPGLPCLIKAAMSAGPRSTPPRGETSGPPSVP